MLQTLFPKKLFGHSRCSGEHLKYLLGTQPKREALSGNLLPWHLLKSKYFSFSLIKGAPYLCDTLNSPQPDSWSREVFKGFSNPRRQSREGEEREGLQRGEGRIHKHTLLCWAWKAPKAQENPLQQRFRRIKKRQVLFYIWVSAWNAK